jgi:hypothetical protein
MANKMFFNSGSGAAALHAAGICGADGAAADSTVWVRATAVFLDEPYR